MAIESRSQALVNAASTTAPASPLVSSQLELSSPPAADVSALQSMARMVATAPIAKGTTARAHSRRPRRSKRQAEKGAVQRHEDCDRDQETEQKLACRAGIFEALVRNLGARPQITANIGGEPEAVNAEREHQQYGAAGKQTPEHFAMTDKTGDARGGRHAGLRRRHGRIEGGHA